MINPIIAKIEKLLRLSKDQDGTPEGETAARLAHRMMTAHAINMAQIDITKQAHNDPMVRETLAGGKLPNRQWRRTLAWVLATHCNCRMATSTWGRGVTVFLYGHKSDIEIIRYLYEICERQLEAATTRYKKILKGKHTGNYYDYDTDEYLPMYGYTSGEMRQQLNSFRRSALDGLRDKLRRIRQDTKNEVGATSYALVRNRKEKVDSWVDDTYTFGKCSSSASYAHNGDGYDAGKNISLHAGIKGSRTKQLGGS
tara:strand:- start:408 stop:1172 length:765 start_codon:yes stop_codon:yes gene_type:complete